MSLAGAAGAGAERLLLIRRDGILWGLAESAVHSVGRPDDRAGYRLRVGEQELEADEVVGVVDGVRIHPSGGVMSRFWSEPAGGLAVHGDTPLVVVDPQHPPSFLRIG